MINLEKGQHFTSQSKIQSQPVEYIYQGQLSNGDYYLEAANGIIADDCEVDEKWFDNRNIIIDAIAGGHISAERKV